MKKFPPAKITAIVTTVVLICILIQIPGALASNPVADPNGPYFMDEGTTKDLDGTGSVDAENYNWIITTDPTDEAYLKKADTDIELYLDVAEDKDRATLWDITEKRLFFNKLFTNEN